MSRRSPRNTPEPRAFSVESSAKSYMTATKTPSLAAAYKQRKKDHNQAANISQGQSMEEDDIVPAKMPAKMPAEEVGWLHDDDDSGDEDYEATDITTGNATRTQTIMHSMDMYVPISEGDHSGREIKVTYSKTQSTPHACLAQLLRNTAKNFGTTIRERPTFNYMNDLADNLNVRTKVTEKGKEIHNSLQHVMTTKINKLPMQQKRLQYIEMWMVLLNKSVSDVAQCGALVNNLHNIRTDNRIIEQFPDTPRRSNQSFNQRTINANKVRASLMAAPTTAFLSSDLIAAAVSTLVLRTVNHPVPTLCNRQVNGVNQAIILQKSEISALSVMLKHAANMGDGFLQIIRQYSGGPSLSQIQLRHIVILYAHITGCIPVFCKALQTKTAKTERYTDSNDFIQSKMDYIFSPDTKKDNNTVSIYQCALCNFIYDIVNMPGNESINDILIDFEKMLTEVANRDVVVHKIPRWTYHVASDIFKYIFSKESDYTVDADEIGEAEFFAATLDATYGHDYQPVSGGKTSRDEPAVQPAVQQLGEIFLEYMGYPKTDMLEVTNEASCIEYVLNKTRFSTINQVGSSFEISFDSKGNFMKAASGGMKLKITETNWKIGESLAIFPNNQFIASIDFVKGEPSVAPLRAAQKNATIETISEDSKTSKDVFEYLIDDKTTSDDFTKIIAEKTRFRELKMSPHEYDCAGSYNGFPLVVLSDTNNRAITTYTSIYTLPASSAKKAIVGGEKLKIRTDAASLTTMKTAWLKKQEKGASYKPHASSSFLVRALKNDTDFKTHLQDIPTIIGDPAIYLGDVKESFAKLLNSIWKSKELQLNLNSIMEQTIAYLYKKKTNRGTRETSIRSPAAYGLANELFEKYPLVDVNGTFSDFKKETKLLSGDPGVCASGTISDNLVTNMIIYVINKLVDPQVSNEDKLFLSSALARAMELSVEGPASGRSIRFITSESTSSSSSSSSSEGIYIDEFQNLINSTHSTARNQHGINNIIQKAPIINPRNSGFVSYADTPPRGQGSDISSEESQTFSEQQLKKVSGQNFSVNRGKMGQKSSSDQDSNSDQELLSDQKDDFMSNIDSQLQDQSSKGSKISLNRQTASVTNMPDQGQKGNLDRLSGSLRGTKSATAWLKGYDKESGYDKETSYDKDTSSDGMDESGTATGSQTASESDSVRSQEVDIASKDKMSTSSDKMSTSSGSEEEYAQQDDFSDEDLNVFYGSRNQSQSNTTAPSPSTIGPSPFSSIANPTDSTSPALRRSALQHNSFLNLETLGKKGGGENRTRKARRAHARKRKSTRRKPVHRTRKRTRKRMRSKVARKNNKRTRRRR